MKQRNDNGISPADCEKFVGRELLDKLVPIITDNQTEKKFSRHDREQLAETILFAEMGYNGARYPAFPKPTLATGKQNDEAAIEKLAREKKFEKRTQLHMLKGPLSEVMLILDHEPNQYVISEVFGSKPNMSQRQAEKVIERYDSFMSVLGKIYRVIPPPQQKPGRGNTSKTKDLRAVVIAAVDEWKRLVGSEVQREYIRGINRRTGKREKRRNTPQAGSGTAFIYDFVRYIDATRIPSLKKVLSDVLTERKKRRSSPIP